MGDQHPDLSRLDLSRTPEAVAPEQQGSHTLPFGIFEVLAYVRFTFAPLARWQRADAARSSSLGGYEFEMRKFLDYVLQAYEVHGVEELSLRKIRDFLRIRYGGMNDAKAALGSVAEIRKAFIDIQGHLFR